MSMNGVNDAHVNGKTFVGASRTRTDVLDECDVNKIMDRAKRGGVIPQGPRQPVYGDVSSVGDFQEAHNRIIVGRTIFDALKPEIRAGFGNDPGRFFKFASNPGNADAVLELRFGKEALNAVLRDRAAKAKVDGSGGVVRPGDESGDLEPGASSERGGPSGAGPDHGKGRQARPEAREGRPRGSAEAG